VLKVKNYTAIRLRRRLLNRRRSLKIGVVKKHTIGFALTHQYSAYRKMKSFLWKGFKVTIVNNHRYGFKYEWEVQAYSVQVKALCYVNKIPNVQYDPTSAKTFTYAKNGGKVRVNECISVNWFKHWHN